MSIYRMCIYAKEISFITGRSERYAREVIRDIRLLHGKDKHQVITIAEACDYLGLPYAEVFKMINGRIPQSS
ncbi:hypothetical protein [Hanstruepera marina]|uniref:hypothetical protein n=1 Tax=Hanstruepera marina TaxID=2873265 RepID=UPI001CA728C9|nr:hypothetical protein [Hanstruepera marina]